MSRPLIVCAFIALTSCVGAFVTDQSSFANRMDRLYEKVERFTVAPKKRNEDLYAKLDRLNSLTPARRLSDDELPSAIEELELMNDEQLKTFVQELQRLNEDDDKESEAAWDDDIYYANDVGEEWEAMDDDGSTMRPGVTPSALTITPPDIDPIAATNERPRILDDSMLSMVERNAIRQAAVTNYATMLQTSKCLSPQSRWLSIKKMAPAADTLYIPPCVQLHRCGPEAGCCVREGELCAPIDGEYVVKEVFLKKVDNTLIGARMQFFNHTRCACVSKNALHTIAKTKADRQVENRRISEDRPTTSQEKISSQEERKPQEDKSQEEKESVSSKQNDWQPASEEPISERDEEQTSPPQLRRCTCPVHFKYRITDGVCSCVCDWPAVNRRRECQSLARGREHFGLRDRVCMSRGECNLPSCEYGAYEREAGKCPHRRFKRRYHTRFHAGKILV